MLFGFGCSLFGLGGNRGGDITKLREFASEHFPLHRPPVEDDEAIGDLQAVGEAHRKDEDGASPPLQAIEIFDRLDRKSVV